MNRSLNRSQRSVLTDGTGCPSASAVFFAVNSSLGLESNRASVRPLTESGLTPAFLCSCFGCFLTDTSEDLELTDVSFVAGRFPLRIPGYHSTSPHSFSTLVKRASLLRTVLTIPVKSFEVLFRPPASNDVAMSDVSFVFVANFKYFSAASGTVILKKVSCEISPLDEARTPAHAGISGREPPWDRKYFSVPIAVEIRSNQPSSAAIVASMWVGSWLIFSFQMAVILGRMQKECDGRVSPPARPFEGRSD